MNHIQPLWNEFEFQSLPKKITAEQTVFAETCFYAGAASLYTIVMKQMLSQTSKKTGAEFFLELEKELFQFLDKCNSI